MLAKSRRNSKRAAVDIAEIVGMRKLDGSYRKNYENCQAYPDQIQNEPLSKITRKPVSVSTKNCR